MEIVAGIDGGGTKTRIACSDLNGNNLPVKEFGAFNFNSIGPARFSALLSEITQYINQIGECKALCIGSAGISNNEMVSAVSDALDQAGIRNWKLVGDNIIAHYGALEGSTGISLIAGTGTICYGCGENGNEARAGGWGHLIGDEGSGYALGRDALAAFAREWDGYGEKTMITKLLSEEWGLDTQRKVISYAYGGDKSKIAALAGVVDQAARAQDFTARKIITDNATALCKLVEAVATNIGLKEAHVAMLGGLLEHDTVLRQAFIAEMTHRLPDMHCLEPKTDACTGAVMIAKTMI